MIMQSYDFLYLNRKYSCKLQLGGDDQWSNIIGGVELIRKKEKTICRIDGVKIIVGSISLEFGNNIILSTFLANGWRGVLAIKMIYGLLPCGKSSNIENKSLCDELIAENRIKTSSLFIICRVSTSVDAGKW